MKRALLVALLLGCAPAIPAQTPSPPPGDYIQWWGPQQIAPTTMHRSIYSMVAECLGVEDDDDAFRGLSWYVTDFILRLSDLTRLGGLWTHDPRRILLDRHRAANNPYYISHEVIHDLTDGTLEHGDPAFVRCEVREYAP